MKAFKTALGWILIGSAVGLLGCGILAWDWLTIILADCIGYAGGRLVLAGELQDDA